MDLMYMNHDRKDLGVLKNPEFDLAFGEDENNFECKISLKDHCCKEGYYIYAEGTEYGGIVDAIEIDSENDLAIYTGRSWHGILASKVIEPLKATDKTEITIKVEGSLRLPEGYKELTHIKSTGTQYINTRFIPNQNTRVVVKTLCLASGSSNHVFGARLATRSAEFSFAASVSKCYRSAYGTENGLLSSTYNQTEPFVIDKNKNITYINGEKTGETSVQTFTPGIPLYLFAFNTNGKVDYGSLPIYIAQIYDNDTLVRDYIACQTASGELGMYDFANNEFYPNAGTGVFIAGEEVSEGTSVVTVKTKDTDGTALVNRYLTLSGDAGYCTKYIVDRINLAPLFVCSENLTDVDLSAYTFERYVDAYSGIRDMLASCGMRLAMICEENTVKLSAVPIFDGSDGKEMESDLIEYQMKKTYNNVNHLICMGSGSYADRQIVHLYLDENGEVSETQTFTGIDERIQFDGEQGEPEEPEETKTAEQLAEEKASLIENGTKKLLDMQAEDEINVSFDSADNIYYVGDIVGAYDSTTNISVAAAVVKKIVSISRGRANIEYKVGAK